MSKKANASETTATSGRTFKPVTGMGDSGIEFIRPAKLAEAGRIGLLLEGAYVGSTPNTYNKDKSDYKFELADGTAKVINGAGNLPFQMKNVAVGTLVQVSYLGKKKISKGPMAGKESHNFLVASADESEA